MRILYIDIDTLRPDHLGCYGYHRNTSPNIDRIAREGVRFENCHCSDAPCLPSRTALMTGQFGIHTGVVGHGGTAADLRLQGQSRSFRDRLDKQSLPSVLRRAGIKPVTISPFAERHSSWSFYAGFSEMHNTGRGGMESAEEITPTVLKWIDQNASQDNWFLHVNYWDPHTPYRAPSEFGNPFAGQPFPDWLNEDLLKRHREAVGPHGAREVNMFDSKANPLYPRHLGELRDMEDLRSFFDGYDCGVAHADQHVGMLLDALEAQGVTDDLAIIVSSDHGENLGELGIYGEHATADRITTRIPLIIRWPGGAKGVVNKGLHYNLDIGPTLAKMLDQSAPTAWDGESFAAAVTDGQDSGRDHLVVSQCAHVAQRSVRFGPWIYMRTWHDGYHLFPEKMLFNIDEDPHETNDLAGKRQNICQQAEGILDQWHADMMSTQPYDYDIDPMSVVLSEGGPYHARGRLAQYCDRLVQTGRQWAVPELRQRHPEEFPVGTRPQQ